MSTDGIFEAAKAHYAALSENGKLEMRNRFTAMDSNGDGKVCRADYSKFTKGYHRDVFDLLDKNGDGVLDFDEYAILDFIYYEHGYKRCKGCTVPLFGVYFVCSKCHDAGETYNICCKCYGEKSYAHIDDHTYFTDPHNLIHIRNSKPDSTDQAKASERLYTDEVRQTKEVEEALARGKEELSKMKQQVGEVVEELHIAIEQKSSLERETANFNQMVKDLEHKLFAAVELWQKYKKERDELQVERDNVLKEIEDLRKEAIEQKSSMESQIVDSNQMVEDLAHNVFNSADLLQKYKKERDELQAERDNVLTEVEDLRKEQSESSNNNLVPKFFYEFSFSEIQEATNDFDLSLKIGEDGYGNIYKGLLHHTEVAIKMLHSDSMQGPSEFQQEVNVLSKLRHPNLVTLIGACPEFFIIVYEYLPNGSLEDRLCCKDNSPPLSWQTRIRIATELCSALIFLHSGNPVSIVHGDLKPANILLDSNFVSKLSEFGICYILDQNTPCCVTNPKGTFLYMDPEFRDTGEITPKSDVYSFGIILLELLTGRPALGIAKEVKHALDEGNLKNLLDPRAGDWPFLQADQLAHIAMRCCEMDRWSRPDLASDMWRILERMRVSCEAPPFLMNSEEDCHIPPYFMCPIVQEIMEDPHVAADGYTYELEAIQGWLDGGHDTSPMTNLKLPHCNLVPNRALRSAIQECQRRRRMN